VTATLYLVDAFAEHAFTGNPAAVCILPRPRAEAWMQSVATEMNQSETAFLSKEGSSWRLRWFTPKVEIDLCGHATLASAHALWEEGLEPAESPVHFATRSGDLVAWHVGGEVELDFPIRRPVETAVPAGLAEALHVRVVSCAANNRDVLVEVASDEVVRRLAPDLRALAAAWRGGVIVTARSRDERWDFVSRFFAPGFGVPEDPVTGSAHCALGPWWGEKLGKADLVGLQVSHRGGVVKVRVDAERTFLRGRAFTVVRGELRT
jgi:predicted PhzF superfamily epimerase YddE/YHI9